jgi:hypothetical protein
MKEKRKRNNVETLPEVNEIPCDNEIREPVDMIAPSNFSDVYLKNLKTADNEGVIDRFRVLDGGVLIAVDGTWFHSSENIHREHCLRKEHKGKITYYHIALAGTTVKPGDSAVIPVMPEMITNKDGAEKRDCGQNAAKRWLENHADGYAWLKPAIPGDDLFSKYPLCRDITDRGMSFIFTRKPQSRKRLTETVENSFLEDFENTEWNGRNNLVYRYKRVNGVEIRDDKETLLVNYMYLEIENKEKGKITYKNSWITDKHITRDNVKHLVSCGRARWKIENEHNNVLKNHGYNLEHNFGHGKQYASDVFCILNLLSFMFHTILDLCDEQYKKLREVIGRRDEFFNILRAALRFALHDSWEAFLVFAIAADDDAPGG